MRGVDDDRFPWLSPKELEERAKRWAEEKRRDKIEGIVGIILMILAVPIGIIIGVQFW